MFEILADHVLPFLSLGKEESPLGSAANKVKKVIYYGLAVTTKKLFNALHSGDIITVYARKI